jgi:hypothetical protein
MERVKSKSQKTKLRIENQLSMAKIQSSTIAGKVYKYVHHEDVHIKTNIIDRPFANEWLRIDNDGTITVLASREGGYAWDGCSPKWHFLDLMFGTPDGRFDHTTEKQITYYASMFHDVMYQFKEQIPLSRLEADIIFQLNLMKAKFLLQALYFFGVRTGGRFSKGKWLREETLNNLFIERWSWIK